MVEIRDSGHLTETVTGLAVGKAAAIPSRSAVLFPQWHTVAVAVATVIIGCCPSSGGRAGITVRGVVAAAVAPDNGGLAVGIQKLIPAPFISLTY